MGDSYRFIAPVYADRLSATTVERVVDRFLEAGFESTTTTDACVEYSVDSGSDPEREVATPGRAGDAIAANGSGHVYLSLDGFEAGVHVALEKTDPAEPSLHVFDREGALVGDDIPESVAVRRGERFLQALAGTVIETDPWGAIGTFLDEGGMNVGYPNAPPAEATLSTLPWVTVFGPVWCDHLGGRDRLLGAPVWDARTLENGAVVLRKTEAPDPEWYANDPLSKKVVIEPTDYVFQGWTTTDPDELRAQELRTSPREYLDPFRSFDEGDYGTDILLCKHHAPFEMGETTYADRLDNDLDSTYRCQVATVQRRGETLWTTGSDEFVRRLVDDDGDPIGDRPADVPPERELLSLTILLEDQRENPPSWYAIDDPDDESISARLNSFIVQSHEHSSMWQDE